MVPAKTRRSARSLFIVQHVVIRIHGRSFGEGTSVVLRLEVDVIRGERFEASRTKNILFADHHDLSSTDNVPIFFRV